MIAMNRMKRFISLVFMNRLTILAANSTNHEYVGGGLSSDITMTYSNGTLSMSGVATVGSCSAGEYTATKQ